MKTEEPVLTKRKKLSKKNPLIETFGTFKFKRSTKEILDESDKECWDE